MTIHRFEKGDRVAVMNNSYSGKPIHEGTATVVAKLDTEDYYEVRFDGEPDATCARFAFVPPGNEADDHLEELRATWRLTRAVAS